MDWEGYVITVELLVNGDWVEVGRVTPQGQLGSLTDRCLGRRDVILFGWIDDRPRVVRSFGGVDLDVGTHRLIATEGLVRLADLTERPHERCVKSDAVLQVRWTLLEP